MGDSGVFWVFLNEQGSSSYINLTRENVIGEPCHPITMLMNWKHYFYSFTSKTGTGTQKPIYSLYITPERLFHQH